ncbi:MAG: SMP-30/gluconolactonase/LRE family protein [Candidatus Reddybacter sp.]
MNNRFAALHGEQAVEPQCIAGWQYTHVTPPSALFGANGMQFGTDGRLYVAQAMGSQVTAIDTKTGELEVIAENGGPITGPDDVAFDSFGNMYSTEVMSAQVTMRKPNGEVTVVADELPSSNGVTVFNDRLFIDEHRPKGRLFELYPHDDRPPRLIAKDLDSPNALAGGPDGKLYFPLVPKGEVWRVDPETGDLEPVTTGLSHPTAVKFTPTGELLSPQAGNGEVVRIDTESGEQTLVAKVRPGIDNLAIDAAGKLYLSHFVDGGVAEVAMDGSNKERVLVAPGWVGPWGIACDTASGTCFVVDGLSLAMIAPDGERSAVGSPLDTTAPRFVRAIAPGKPGEFLMSTARGDVLRYDFATETTDMLVVKLGQLKGLCAAEDGGVLVVRENTNSVLAISSSGEISTLVEGLSAPTDVFMWQGKCYVSDTGVGRLLEVSPEGEVTTFLDGLFDPRGIAAIDNTLYVLDRAAHSIWAIDLAGEAEPTKIATHLPIGAICPLDFAGGLCVDGKGGLLVAADGEGSILRLSRV